MSAWKLNRNWQLGYPLALDRMKHQGIHCRQQQLWEASEMNQITFSSPKLLKTNNNENTSLQRDWSPKKIYDIFPASPGSRH